MRQDAEALVVQIDTDGDGRLSREELYAAFCAGKPRRRHVMRAGGFYYPWVRALPAAAMEELEEEATPGARARSASGVLRLEDIVSSVGERDDGTTSVKDMRRKSPGEKNCEAAEQAETPNRQKHGKLPTDHHSFRMRGGDLPKLVKQCVAGDVRAEE